MATMVKVNVGERADLLQIPSSSIFESDNNSYVYLYSNDSHTVTKTQVQMIQLLSDGKCVIASEKLKVQDKIVAFGTKFLSDGCTVKILEPVSSTNIGGLL